VPGESRAPAGLLFTDLEGSTSHLRALGDAYGPTLTHLVELLAAAVHGEAGEIVGSEGDSVAAVFSSTARALRAAVGAQRLVGAERWPDSPWRVRMAVHAGPVDLSGKVAAGAALHEAARVRNTAHGGQIVVTEAAKASIDEPLAADLRLSDLGLHEVKDIDDAVRLYQVVVPGVASDFPPLRSTVQRGIPRALTSFVGRKSEVDELEHLLNQHRVVTVTGTGGSGKTRLAYEVAAHASNVDVRVVELADVRTDEEVVAAVAGAFGATDVAGVARSIGDQPLLLVLDNCEHVLDAAASVVADLVRSCPGLKLLVTSREPLAMSGERPWHLPRLSPDEALALLRDRAPRPLSDDELIAAAQICEQLDGVPLAIELAAARLRSLGVDELATRLNDQLALLTSGLRTAPRHQTLRAALDWSHDVLDQSERSLFRALSVFAGGFELEAAERVAGDRVASLIDSLDGLVQKSLVEFEPDANRYRMLEPVRQYAHEQLVAMGEVEGVHTDHLRWVAELSDTANRRMFVDQARWTARLDPEVANIGAALGYALEHDVETASRITSALAFYWFTSQRQTATVWVERLVDRLDELSPRSQARALLAAGMAFCEDQRDTRAVGWLRSATERFRVLGHDRGLAASLFWLGRALAMRDEWDELRGIFSEALGIHERLGDELGGGWCRLWLGVLARRHGDLERAEAILHDVARRARQAGVPHVLGGSLSELAEVKLEAGDLDRAELLTSEAIELFETLGDRFQIASNYYVRAAINLDRDTSRSVADVLSALELAEVLHSEPSAFSCFALIALVVLAQGETERAATLAGAGRIDVDTIDERLWRGPFTAYQDELRAVLSEPRLAGAVEMGRRLGLRPAIQLAREWVLEAYPSTS
jgi:predicted ATPase